jgi:hypothetical protein
MREKPHSQGRFTTRYAPEEGWNTLPDGEEIFFIGTPSAGPWATREKILARGPDSKT